MHFPNHRVPSLWLWREGLCKGESSHTTRLGKSSLKRFAILVKGTFEQRPVTDAPSFAAPRTHPLPCPTHTSFSPFQPSELQGDQYLPFKASCVSSSCCSGLANEHCMDPHTINLRQGTFCSPTSCPSYLWIQESQLQREVRRWSMCGL